MGQLITVTVQVGSSDDVRIFSLDRSLTGMGIERYASVADIRYGRAPDVLARRVFDLGAESVTIYSSAVSVTAPAASWSALEPKVSETIEHLFGYYGDDAGYAPDALRAIGVEPLPTPEPAA